MACVWTYAAVDSSPDPPILNPIVPAPQVCAGGLVYLVRLQGHPACNSAARRVLSSILDYLLHLTPLDGLVATSASSATPGAGVASACPPMVAEDDRAIEPLCGGAGLAAHADVISSMHALDGVPTRLAALPDGDDAARLLARLSRQADAKDYSSTVGDSPPLGYCCNLDVFSLLLREGYIASRAGSSAQPLLHAINACAPPKNEKHLPLGEASQLALVHQIVSRAT